MKQATDSAVLRRYTDLPSVLHLLTSRTITFLSPQLWEDKNDAFYLETYRRQSGLKSLQALCFTRETERYHHWKVFAPGISGVCISFSRYRLLKGFKDLSNIRHREVEYRTIQEVKAKPPEGEELLFVKRYPFQDEHEYRIVFENREEMTPSVSLPVELGAIERIVLNPWLPSDHFDSVKTALKTIPGCSRLRVHKTSLINNPDWQAALSE